MSDSVSKVGSLPRPSIVQGVRVLGILALGATCGTATPQTGPAEPLPAAVLEAPAIDYTRCGQIAAWPEAPITLEWNTVAGAVAYSVEVDCYGCRNQPVAPPQPWFSLSGTPWHIQNGLDRTYATDIVSTLRSSGGRDMRWRVWGVDSLGRAGPASDWCVLPFSDSGKPTPGAPAP